uniref:MYND-type domain-containing protein n=1 Tax=Mycena chlorophos TaxID=658473 RepID=A0ABQ0M580_MYCCL|nr:predicted protein [Mycena chlorophos]
MSGGNLYLSGLKNACVFCRKTGVPLRQCAGCKVAEYCSKECQKANWKQHKPHCQQTKQDKEDFAAYSASDPIAGKRVKAFVKFNQIWSGALFAWAACAVDLGTMPERDPMYLAKHSFYMTIERRKGVPLEASVKTSYKVLTAGMRPNEDILADFTRLDVQTGYTDAKTRFEAQAKQANPGSVIVVVVEPDYYLLSVMVDSILKTVPEEDLKVETWFRQPILTSALSLMWLQSCKENILKGNTSGYAKLIRDVKQAIGVD